MPEYRFEIVRRAKDLYSWQLVELRGGRRRVLTLDPQEHNSKDEARSAIPPIKDALKEAVVVDTTESTASGTFRRPKADFRLIADAVPLIIDGGPAEYKPAPEPKPPAPDKPVRRKKQTNTASRAQQQRTGQAKAKATAATNRGRKKKT